ncbi:MAG: nucleoside-diphosphate kinase, partial [Verrucomicrobiales bacterium]
MATETTLILFKTDCVQKKLVGQVLQRFEAEGFAVRGIKMMELTSELLSEHYSHVADKPFFPEIVAFMQASPVIALALEGEDAVSRVRDLLGPTDSTKA